MYIKIFTDTKKVNAFIDTVDLGEKGSVQYADKEIIIFYECLKSDKEQRYKDLLLEESKESIYFNEIREISLKADLKAHKKLKSNEETIQTTKDRMVECKKNIALYKARIKALTK